MIQPLDRSRVPSVLAGVLQQCSARLHPLLRRLLNPNVVDALIGLDIMFQNGSMNHMRELNGEPSYVNELASPVLENDHLVRTELTRCLKTVRFRIENALEYFAANRDPKPSFVIRLRVAISGGQATISSEADWVHKPGK